MIHANRLPAWRIENRRNDLCRFDRIESNRQHFQPTLYSPPEVKIREITIHEPSSFLKRGHKLQSIRTIRVDSIESTRIDNIFNPPSKYRSTIFSKSRTNRQKGKRFVLIRWNRVHESISGLSNRKYQRRIDSVCMYVCMKNATCWYFSIVKRFIEEDRLPHLLFYGPPGTGKTSTILAVAKQIYSAREFNSMVLEVGIHWKLPGITCIISIRGFVWAYMYFWGSIYSKWNELTICRQHEGSSEHM